MSVNELGFEPSLIEKLAQTLAEHINNLVGVDAATPDAGLPAAYRVKSCKGNEGLDPQDLTNGPLVRVEIDSLVQEEQEFGNEEGRTSRYLAPIAITIASNPQVKERWAKSIAAKLEEVIRLRVYDWGADVSIDYFDGREAVMYQLNWIGAENEVISFADRQHAPEVDDPVPAAGNAGNVTLLVDQEWAYEGLDSATFAVTIVTPNLEADLVDGLSYAYTVNGGAVKGPFLALNEYEELEDGVYIKFEVSGIAQAGDTWTIQAKANDLNYVAGFRQDWIAALESNAVDV